jgi:guanine deaminase
VVFQENGSGVKHVMIDGRFVVRNRHILTVDYAKLREEVTRASERLRLENQDAARLVRQLEPLVGQFCIGLSREPYHVNRTTGPS